jgi:hypothetical protein
MRYNILFPGFELLSSIVVGTDQEDIAFYKTIIYYVECSGCCLFKIHCDGNIYSGYYQLSCYQMLGVHNTDVDQQASETETSILLNHI